MPLLVLSPVCERGGWFTSKKIGGVYKIVGVSEKTGSPPSGYTDEQWQRDFSVLKSLVKKSKFNQMTVIPENSNYKDEPYHGKSQYQYYCDFINDILSQIRKGKIDYCFYIYQIAELLKYEHDSLNAEWLEDERCFRLSLNKTEY